MTHSDSSPEEQHRPIRSFVRREGRMTPSQKHALDTLWPHYGLECDEGFVDPHAVFGRLAPLEVEIGCGNGDALLEMATARPGHDFIGVEVYRPGVGKLLSGIEANGLGNVRIACRDAVELVRHCISPASVARFLVLFPDPWPKKRHHKRRLLQADFIHLLAETLTPGGELVIATDWQDYAEFAMAEVSAEPLLQNPYGTGHFAATSAIRPPTKYERRGRRLGHEVFDIVARRLP